MGTWGSGNFENDAAMDFIDQQIDSSIHMIEAIFDDADRFLLDEDAEGMLMPSIEILVLLCERCGGILPNTLDVATWKARYLDMYDDQIDGLAPAPDYKQQRRAVIAATFDTLLRLYEKQWRSGAE